MYFELKKRIQISPATRVANMNHDPVVISWCPVMFVELGTGKYTSFPAIPVTIPYSTIWTIWLQYMSDVSYDLVNDTRARHGPTYIHTHAYMHTSTPGEPHKPGTAALVDRECTLGTELKESWYSAHGRGAE